MPNICVGVNWPFRGTYMLDDSFTARAVPSDRDREDSPAVVMATGQSPSQPSHRVYVHK